MNRKAYIGEGIVNLWAIILIVLIIITFWILFNVSDFTKKGVEQIIKDDKIFEGNILLVNYLKSEVIVDEKRMNFADLILLSSLKYDYGILRKKTIEFMQQNDLCFDLIILLPEPPGMELAISETAEIKISNICSRGGFGERQIFVKKTSMFLPSLSNLIEVELRLYE